MTWRLRIIKTNLLVIFCEQKRLPMTSLLNVHHVKDQSVFTGSNICTSYSALKPIFLPHFLLKIWRATEQCTTIPKSYKGASEICMECPTHGPQVLGKTIAHKTGFALNLFLLTALLIYYLNCY